MDLNSLEAFVQVAQLQSFTAAAKALGVQRAAVSRRVSALEAQLGVTLLIRSTRSVMLTTAGRALLEESRDALARLKRALKSLPEASGEPAGELRVSTTQDIAWWLLPEVLAELAARFPLVRPNIDTSNRLVDMEREGFDVALRIVRGSLEDSNLRARRLGRIVLRLYGAPDYIASFGVPERLVDLESHIVIGHRRAVQVEFSCQSFMAADGLVIARELARRGVGLAALSSFIARDAVESGELVPLMTEQSFGEGTLYALFPSSRRMPSKVEVFRDAVVNFVEANPLPEG